MTRVAPKLLMWRALPVTDEPASRSCTGVPLLPANSIQAVAPLVKLPVWLPPPRSRSTPCWALMLPLLSSRAVMSVPNAPPAPTDLTMPPRLVKVPLRKSVSFWMSSVPVALLVKRPLLQLSIRPVPLQVATPLLTMPLDTPTLEVPRVLVPLPEMLRPPLAIKLPPNPPTVPPEYSVRPLTLRLPMSLIAPPLRLSLWTARLAVTLTAPE